MANRPSAYVGDQPHIFISYAHKDSARVYPIIEGLQKRGVRVWYDEGLEVGSQWSNVIAENILKCEYMVCFISDNFIASENCKNEIHMATEEKKGPLIIYLDRVNLTPEMRLQYGRIHALSMENYGGFESFVDAIADAECLQNCRKSGSRRYSYSEDNDTGDDRSYSGGNYSSSGISSESSSYSSSSYSSTRYSSSEIPGFIQVLMLLGAIGTLLVSIITLFLGSRSAIITSLICSGVFIVLFILIIIAVKCSWGFDYMDYSDGWLVTAIASGIAGAVALCVSFYLLHTLYGVEDMIIRDDVLVKSYMNQSTVEAPDGIVEIGENAFGQYWQSRGNKVRCIVLPDSVEIIDDYAFENCVGLVEVYIGNNVKSIGAGVFTGCSKLSTIYFRGTQAEWDAIYKNEGFLQNWNFGVEDCDIVFIGSEPTE